jgi:hypothetical protein
MTTKCTNDHKIFQMAIKYINIFHSKASKIYPNWDFCNENIPSGNPVSEGSTYVDGIAEL